jgi:DNA modification methylase
MTPDLHATFQAEAVRQIGDCTMICGDMRQVLHALDLQADLILTDPPYRLTAGGNSTAEMGGIFAHGRYDNSGDLFPMVEWADMAPLFWKTLGPSGDAVVMTSDREMGAARVALQAEGFGFHRILVWDKVTATPNRWFMPNCEFALYLYKGRARTITDPSSKQLVKVPHRDETDHQTEKPVLLMSGWMHQCSAPGSLVVDPFMGSGSTAVAAVQLGRRYVGIELQPRWFDAACARVEEALRQRGRQGVMHL